MKYVCRQLTYNPSNNDTHDALNSLDDECKLSIRLLFFIFLFSYHFPGQVYYINYGKYEGFLETITQKLYQFPSYCPSSSTLMANNTSTIRRRLYYIHNIYVRDNHSRLDCQLSMLGVLSAFFLYGA